MTDQPELDLAPPVRGRPAPRSAPGFAGLTRGQQLCALGLLIALVWAMWVTRSVIQNRKDHIVSARLSSIVGDYVAAQARSASPPAQVAVETRTFLSGLDREIQRRSAKGEVVLVGEAVLTKNVPDITDSLRRAVFAAGAPDPRAAAGADNPPARQREDAAGLPAPPPPAAGSAAYLNPPAVASRPAPAAAAIPDFSRADR